jgi:hypothetical protein
LGSARRPWEYQAAIGKTQRSSLGFPANKYQYGNRNHKVLGRMMMG